MISRITFKNFRNFEDFSLHFDEQNLIIGKNGQWKSNILEWLSLFGNPLLEIPFPILAKEWSDFFHIWVEFDSGKDISLFYDTKTEKKVFQIGKKATTKKKILELYPKVISFHPLSMNMLYLGPSERRLFLDEILAMSDSQYSSLLSIYKKVLSSRNKLLKNISEGKSEESELDFWDDKFVSLATEIYKRREDLRNFFEKNIGKLISSFTGKIQKLQFIPLVKIERNAVRQSLEEYLKKNRKRDILIRKTHIWPHIDDFDIHLDTHKPIATFASRGEVKSILLGLKFLSIEYIESKICEKPIFIIDDLLSELDTIHRELLLTKFQGYQIFLSSIEDIDFQGNKIYI